MGADTRGAGSHLYLQLPDDKTVVGLYGESYAVGTVFVGQQDRHVAAVGVILGGLSLFVQQAIIGGTRMVVVQMYLVANQRQGVGAFSALIVTAILQ